MSLRALAQQHWQQFSSDANYGFAEAITLTAPNGTTITVNGLHTKHHTSIDTLGAPINGKNSHVSISEDLLATYPVRNAKGEVSLARHKVQVKDSTGLLKTYSVREAWPDETLGVILITLIDHE